MNTHSRATTEKPCRENIKSLTASVITATIHYCFNIVCRYILDDILYLQPINPGMAHQYARGVRLNH